MVHYLQRITLLAILFLICSTQYVYAFSPSEYMKSSLDAILLMLNDPLWKTEEGRQKLYPKLRSKIHGMFDYHAVSAQILGKKWGSFTTEEKEEFSKVLANLLEYTYASYFINYKGEEISFVNSRQNKTGTQAEVVIEVKNTGKQPITMVYRLLKKDEHTWKIYNVIVDNINLILSYKTQLEEDMQQRTPSELIKRLKQQNISHS